MNVLALSSSRAAGGPYLETAVPLLREFFMPISGYAVFIPFALVNGSWEDYLRNVQSGLEPLGLDIRMATGADSADLISGASMIFVGGGNTFHLTQCLYQFGLMDLIRQRVKAGVPYAGWSAGANLTGMSIRTTNDMPIIEPKSFDALGFLPFQINPHYQNLVVPGFHGETRDDRLTEFCMLNQNTPVVGIPEGTALHLRNDKLIYLGLEPATLFLGKNGQVEKKEISAQTDLSYLLTR